MPYLAFLWRNSGGRLDFKTYRYFKYHIVYEGHTKAY